VVVIANEDEILREVKKSQTKEISMSLLDYESKQRPFQSYVRVMGWVKRFIHNLKGSDKCSGSLTGQELRGAEVAVIRSIQQDVFGEKEKNPFGRMEVLKDEREVLHVKTRTVRREDLVVSNKPYILPGSHPIVRQLIRDYHTAYCHAGVGFLLKKLRQKYWIIQARKSIKSVVSKCPRCRRMAARPVVAESAPLPLDRIKDAEVFEVVGVDLAGPLILKNKKKVWLVVFTCAVYRAVYLDVVESLSTRAFITCLGKFMKKYRRPAIIYSDNGTNFRGSDNLFRSLDWGAIEKSEDCQLITWKFNPPSGPWWGGWWERVIRTIKDLLARRSLPKWNFRRHWRWFKRFSMTDP